MRNSLLEQLRDEGYSIVADCNGSGRCGKCKVRLLEGELPITEQDRTALTQAELTQGVRLACCAYPSATVRVEPLQETTESDAFDLRGIDNQGLKPVESHFIVPEEKLDSKLTFPDREYQIAMDLGTTTLVFLLFDATGRICATKTSLNPQRVYGADVIARIQAANDGYLPVLCKMIRTSVSSALSELITEGGGRENQPISVSRLALAGNTTMIHLLMGYSCAGLGVYPYTPVHLGWIRCPLTEVFSIEHQNAFTHTELVIFPGISTYIGGDIVAGMYGLDFLSDENAEFARLMIDLGTNGEMACEQNGRIIVTSVAAGPAFEGGNISCGMGGVAGAITDITIEEKQVTKLSTIGNAVPQGLCGSGLLALMAQLLSNGIMDESGLLCESYFTSGFHIAVKEDGTELRILQKDIRAFQLAKAAVRAGVNRLLLTVGSEKCKLFLAGGFGQEIKQEYAEAVGMLPPLSSFQTVGNSCMRGLRRYLFESDAEARIDAILKHSTECDLSLEETFSEDFLDALSFPPTSK